MATDTQKLLNGIELAKAGRWDEAHGVAQSLEGDQRADWLHAILHKIEGDAANSRYWYSRTHYKYETFADSAGELDALEKELEAERGAGD
jgi:hypothetical protein